MRPCVGCGGAVPDIDGPAHAYMESSPGCWQWFGELNAAGAYTADAADLVRGHAVDCFAAQHPGGAAVDRRQRQSVAVHLTALCLVREFGLPAGRLSRARQRMGATVLPRLGLADWPYLEPPPTLGPVTVADVRRADDLVGAVDVWSAGVWQAWEMHHDTVRGFARVAS